MTKARVMCQLLLKCCAGGLTRALARVCSRWRSFQSARGSCSGKWEWETL